MYCRVCGRPVRDDAYACTGCGCRPFDGNDFCPECGIKTNPKQVICVRCGVSLSNNTTGASHYFSDNNVLRRTVNTINNGVDYGQGNYYNANFSGLSPYWQSEFSKIAQSNESYKGGFNVCAFLFGPFWAFSKGCWLAGLIALIGGILTAGVIAVAYWFIFGFRGNYMYYSSYTKNKQLAL
jgi:hypothetical protein